MKDRRAFWPNRSQALGSRLDRNVAHPSVLEYLIHDSSVRDLQWNLACSGGPDSVALVLWCWAHFGGYRTRMRVVHFQHNTRGDESRQDLEFVKELAEGLRLDFCAEEAEAWSGKPSEEDLRNARLAYFESIRAERSLLFTGHHLDDVMETQWMRLARGTSPAGLSAPRPLDRDGPDGTVLRPFINLLKADIEAALQGASAPYRKDPSNEDPSYFRNRIRQDLIPLWKALAPGDPEAGPRITREWMEEDERALAEWSRHLLQRARIQPHVLDLKGLKGVPKAIWRRIILEWLGDNLGRNPFSHNGLEKALEAIRREAERRGDGFRISCGSREALVGASGKLAIEWAVPEERLQPGPLVPGIPRLLPLGYELKLEEIVLREEERKAILSAGHSEERVCVLDREKLEASGFRDRLWIRQWEAGDQYDPLGSPGSRKLQDCFTDRKIPEKERKQRPIVCLQEGGIILWCPGLLPSERFKIGPATESALRLTYRSTSTA